MKNKNLKKEINKIIENKKLNYILAAVFSQSTKKSPEESLEIINNLFDNSIKDLEKELSVISNDINK